MLIRNNLHGMLNFRFLDWGSRILETEGGAHLPNGVPVFLGKTELGFQFSWGAQNPVTAAP